MQLHKIRKQFRHTIPLLCIAQQEAKQKEAAANLSGISCSAPLDSESPLDALLPVIQQVDSDSGDDAFPQAKVEDDEDDWWWAQCT